MPASGGLHGRQRRARPHGGADRACVYVFGLVFVAIAVIVFLAVLVSNIAAPAADSSSGGGGGASGIVVAHSDALSGCPGVQWRASDGSDRGKKRWTGAAGTRNHRYVYPGTMVNDTYSDRGRPNARIVSLAVCKQAARTPQHKRFSSLMWPFGQFVDHIVTLSASTNDVPPIVINVTGDAQFEICDNRSLRRMYEDMAGEGLQPVLNDYVYL